MAKPQSEPEAPPVTAALHRHWPRLHSPPPPHPRWPPGGSKAFAALFPSLWAWIRPEHSHSTGTSANPKRKTSEGPSHPHPVPLPNPPNNHTFSSRRGQAQREAGRFRSAGPRTGRLANHPRDGPGVQLLGVCLLQRIGGFGSW